MFQDFVTREGEGDIEREGAKWIDGAKPGGGGYDDCQGGRRGIRPLPAPAEKNTSGLQKGGPVSSFMSIVIYWNKLKRYILTAMDYATRLGYARMYKRKGSRVAVDFLYRLLYLTNQH